MNEIKHKIDVAKKSEVKSRICVFKPYPSNKLILREFAADSGLKNQFKPIINNTKDNNKDKMLPGFIILLTLHHLL